MRDFHGVARSIVSGTILAKFLDTLGGGWLDVVMTTTRHATQVIGWSKTAALLCLRPIIIALVEGERRWFLTADPVRTLPAPISSVGVVVMPMLVAWMRWGRSLKVTTARPIVVGWRYFNWTWRTERFVNLFSARVACWERDAKSGKWHMVAGRVSAGRK